MIQKREESAASHLAAILLSNEVDPPTIPDELKVGELTLVPEQRQAVRFALSHRLSIILGGAGSGKTTLIRAIAAQYGNESRRVLCAPTGKAARNLTERTGCVARTIHSALGMHPNDDFLSPVIWENVGLVIVDEASMVSLEMLAGILCTVREDCRIVLLGDCNQLLSVGSGNVLLYIISSISRWNYRNSNCKSKRAAKSLRKRWTNRSGSWCCES